MESALWNGGGLVAIVVLLLWTAKLADTHGDTKQLYLDLWSKGTPGGHISAALKGGDRLFGYLFETKSGRFSPLRSAIATFVISVGLAVATQWERVLYPSFWIIVALVVVSTVLPDAASLLQTRWLIRKFTTKRRGFAQGLAFLFGDLLLTTAITLALFPLIFWVAIAPSRFCGGEPITCFDWSVASQSDAWSLITTPLSWLVGVDRTFTAADWECHSRYSWEGVLEVAEVSFVAIFTGYVTSFWLWITVVGSWLAGVVRWLNHRLGYKLIARLKVEEYPCTSLVIVVSVPTLLIAGVVALF